MATLLRAEQFFGDRQLSAARVAYNQAEREGASYDRCCAGRWMISMLEGDFEAAWQESDAIRLRDTPDPHRFWSGEAIQGANVIVRSLHGFGDAVQMLRYAPMLHEKASKVVFEVPPRFVELAHCFHGIDEVITWGAAVPAATPAWDVQIEVMELPYLFRTTMTDLPLFTNYLNIPQRDVRHAAEAMRRPGAARRRPRIGLVWAGGDWNPQRSIPFTLLAPLLIDKTVEFWNLQGGVAAQDARAGVMRDATAECGDGLLRLAATIANLDLVITVDTLAAHLAGALNVPAWVMLEYAADWRWVAGRSDSPWYPSLRLFRQRQPHDWTGVVKEVQDALAALLSCYALEHEGYDRARTPMRMG